MTFLRSSPEPLRSLLHRRKKSGIRFAVARGSGQPGDALADIFAFEPARTLAQNDDLLNQRDLLHEAEGEGAPAHATDRPRSVR
jgi:hypothetical protein